MRIGITVLAMLLSGSGIAWAEDRPLSAAAYLDGWLARFPTRATAAGSTRFDRQLEDLDADDRRDWVAFNKRAMRSARRHLADPKSPMDSRLDMELVLREAERNVYTFEALARPERDPLFWTRIVGNASVFLLVRDSRPLDERLRAVAARTKLIPRLLAQARRALKTTKPAHMPRPWCELAARQARAAAKFYRQGLPKAASGHGPKLAQALKDAGTTAARALDAFARYLDQRAETATGSPRLGASYPELFRIVTGDPRSPDVVLAAAERALVAKRQEAAVFARKTWPEIFPRDAIPARDVDVLRRMFDRLGQDHAPDAEAFVADYRRLVADSIQFVKRHRIVTMPDPLTLRIDRSPPYFVGQSVGGVYPAGPFNPEEDTLLYVPTPPADATPSQRQAFFRDFNDHFNVMITPHEIIPGHYLQLKFAARHPHKVRAMFPDGVYVEGWGTFCERLMLDEGWGDALDRLAHYKKQLENIARTIVDIRVHTKNMTRDAVLAFVRDEALQDAQFARNMWTRSITSAPQLTFYWLGYEAVYGLFDSLKADAQKRGETFDLKRFNDAMMALGPVPVRHYRARFGLGQ